MELRTPNVLRWKGALNKSSEPWLNRMGFLRIPSDSFGFLAFLWKSPSKSWLIKGTNHHHQKRECLQNIVLFQPILTLYFKFLISKNGNGKSRAQIEKPRLPGLLPSMASGELCPWSSAVWLKKSTGWNHVGTMFFKMSLSTMSIHFQGSPVRSVSGSAGLSQFWTLSRTLSDSGVSPCGDTGINDDKCKDVRPIVRVKHQDLGNLAVDSEGTVSYQTDGVWKSNHLQLQAMARIYQLPS